MADENKKDKLLSKLNSRFTIGRDNKTEAEQQALININYINGNQHIEYDKVGNIINAIPDEDSENSYRETESFNKLKNMARAVFAQVKDRIPKTYAIPVSQLESHLDAAKATSAVLNDMYEANDLIKKLKEVSHDMIEIGPSFLKVSWDDNMGEVLIDDMDALLGEVSGFLSDEEKQKLYMALENKTKAMTGDVKVEAIPLYQIYVHDQFEEDLHKQKWMFRAVVTNKHWIKEKFGVDVEPDEMVSQLTNQPMNNVGVQRMVENLTLFTRQNNKSAIILKEYYEKPTSKHPDGRYILFASDTILHEGPLPFINAKDGKRTYPFIKFGIHTRNKFYSHAFIHETLPVQRRHNFFRNRAAERVAKNIHGNILVQEGSLPDDQVISGKPGSFIYYKAGFSPPRMSEMSHAGNLDINNEVSSLSMEMVEMSGISAISTTGTPSSSNIRSGEQFQMVLEGDNSKFSIIIDELITGATDLSKMAIRLYRQFLNPESVKFSRHMDELGSTVKWNSNLLTEKIDIANKEEITTTPARRKEQFQQLMSSGLLDPEKNMLGPAATIEFLKYFDLGIPRDQIPVKGREDIDKAMRENKKIVGYGVPIAVDPFDNHEIHLETHLKYLKSAEYAQMMVQVPQVDQIFREHIQGHFDIVEKKQIQIQAAMALEAQKK